MTSTRPPDNPTPSDGQWSQSTDEELLRLRAEVAELRAQLASAPPAPTGVPPTATSEPGRRRGWWRPVVVAVCVALAGILAPASVLATWARDEVADTDRYVETVAPLADDPAVQQAIVTRVTTELFTRIDVQALTQDAVDALADQGLPPRVSQGLSALSVPIASGIRSFVTDQVTRLVQSQTFADAWEQANREAHTQLVAVLSGEGTDTVSVENNAVSINLASLINAAKQQLSAAGFTLAERIPTVNAQFTIFQSADLARAQTAFRLLDTLARWLPVLALVLLAVAVAVARDRRKALIGGALVIAVSMLLLGATLNVFRPVYLNALDSAVLSPDAAAAVYDQLVGFIRLNLRAVLVVALAIAVAAWATGHGATATRARAGLSAGIGWLRGGAENAGLRTGPVGAFVYAWRSVLRAVIVGAAALVYLLEDHPTGATALTVLVITVAALLVVEFLARPPAPGESTPGSPEGVQAAAGGAR